jgi:hypothetical protein
LGLHSLSALFSNSLLCAPLLTSQTSFIPIRTILHLLCEWGCVIVSLWRRPLRRHFLSHWFLLRVGIAH